MKNKFFKKTITLVLVLVFAFSSLVFASAETTINLITVYGSTLADVDLPDGYIWTSEDPTKESTGEVGNKVFSAKTLVNGEYVNVAVEVMVEPAYISEVYASTNSSLYYTGQPVIPEVKAYFNGKELVEDIDYKLICSDNINVGTAKITIEGIGNFKGKTSFNFSIVKKDVDGIIINPTEVELIAGKAIEIGAEIITEDATFKGITWSSSDNDIASVDKNGIVTAINEGVAIITATSNDGGYTAECVVNVVVHDDEDDHKYNYVSSTEPGCETEGRVSYKCVICEHEKTETILAVGHNYSEYYDYGSNRTHILGCSDCDKTTIQSHIYSEWVSNGDATFFKNGTKRRTCLCCGFSETLTDVNSSVFLQIIATVYESFNWFLASLTEIINSHFNL